MSKICPDSMADTAGDNNDNGNSNMAKSTNLNHSNEEPKSGSTSAASDTRNKKSISEDKASWYDYLLCKHSEDDDDNEHYPSDIICYKYVDSKFYTKYIDYKKKIVNENGRTDQFEADKEEVEYLLKQ